MEIRQPQAAQQFQKLDRRIQNLRQKVRILRSSLWILMILFFLSIAYQVYCELQHPLFGKWPKIAKAKASLEQRNQAMLVHMDSLSRANDILMENSPYYTGVFYEVQIGAFQHFDLSNYGDALSQFRVEYKEELHKYTLGKFREFEMAEAFRKDMEKLGIKDAFVIAKINGERVTIEEAKQAQQEDSFRL